MVCKPINRSLLVARMACAGVVLLSACKHGTEPTVAAPPVAQQLLKVAGDGQAAMVTMALAQPLVVKLVDGTGKPVAGRTVSWSVITGGGSVAFIGAPTSDAAGGARATWTLGSTAGTQSAMAQVDGVGPATFTATAGAGPAAIIAISPITAIVLVDDTTRLTVQMRDAYGNDVSNEAVAWTTSNASVAAVRNDGWVTGIAPGSTSITVRIQRDTTKRALAAISVNAAPPRVTSYETPVITSNFMRLTGVVSPRGAPTSVWFHYGTDPSLAIRTETGKFGPWSQATGVGQDVGQLQANTRYYYRILGENSVGRSTGDIVSVVTSPSSGTTLLTQSGRQGASGSSTVVQFQVPAGLSRLEVTASGGSGDVDLFLRYGAAPTVDDADCYSDFHPASFEVCAIDNPRAGTWYALLYGFTAYSSVTLSVSTYASPIGGSPAIGLSTSSVAFSAQPGGSNPASQTVSVSNTGGGTLSGMTTNVSYGSGSPTGWLTASLSGTTAPATLTLSAATGSLVAGSYSATVSLASSAASNSPQTVSVTFTVGTVTQYVVNGVWVHVLWGTADVTPSDRKDVADPSLQLGDYCPKDKFILRKRNSGSTAQVEYQSTCPNFSIWSCVAKGSDPQPSGTGGGLQECATDPLLTEFARLKADRIQFDSDPTIVTFLYYTSQNLSLNIFYCKGALTLVGPPTTTRLQCR